LLPPSIANLFGDSLNKALKSQLAGGAPGTSRSLPMAITTGLLDFIVMVFISIYTLLGKSGMRKFVLSLLPEDKRPRVREVMSSMADAMGGYIRGAVVNGLIMGVLTSLGLLILGVRFALLLGTLTGILELVPVIGPILAGAIIVALALLQDPTKALEALIFMIALQQLEGHILVPNIMRSQTDISPVLSIVALLAGAEIGGLLGLAVSLPIAAALTVLIREVVAPAIRRQTGAGKTAAQP
jgi:predicted PurR-regulated permease PerM